MEDGTGLTGHEELRVRMVVNVKLEPGANFSQAIYVGREGNILRGR